MKTRFLHDFNTILARFVSKLFRSTTGWVSLLDVPKGTCSQFYDRLRLMRTVLRASKFPVFQIDSNCFCGLITSSLSASTCLALFRHPISMFLLQYMYRVFQKTCNNFLPLLKLGLSREEFKLYIKSKPIIIQFCWLWKFLKMIPNKSSMTSYIKSPYFRLFPISVTLDLTIDCITAVVKCFINAYY